MGSIHGLDGLVTHLGHHEAQWIRARQVLHPHLLCTRQVALSHGHDRSHFRHRTVLDGLVRTLRTRVTRDMVAHYERLQKTALQCCPYAQLLMTNFGNMAATETWSWRPFSERQVLWRRGERIDYLLNNCSTLDNCRGGRRRSCIGSGLLLPLFLLLLFGRRFGLVECESLCGWVDNEAFS